MENFKGKNGENFGGENSPQNAKSKNDQAQNAEQNSQKDKNLQKIGEFLSKNPIQILATKSENFGVNARPIGSAMIFGGRLFYCMNKNKRFLTDEIARNCDMCVCVVGENFSWLRLWGRAKFCDEIAVKQEYIARGKTRFKDSSDENFAVFEICEIKVEIHCGFEIENIEI